MTKAERIERELAKRFDEARFEGDEKTISLTFKETGNEWKLAYHLHYGGTRYGFSKGYFKASRNGEEKHFRSRETLAKAIAAGYIR